MTGYDSDSSLQLSGDALKRISAAESDSSGSMLNFDPHQSAWSFDPTDSESLEVIVADESGTVLGQRSFHQPFILIGRASKCDLRLEDESVSFRHAYLQRMYGRVLCVDLASRSGTSWNRKELPYGWFDEHHPIRIGPYQLRLGSTIQEQAPAEPEFDPKSFFRTVSKQALLPAVSLQHLARSGPGEAWTINRPITLVGSCSRCRLRLSGQSVSKVHCSLLLMPDGLWVVDLLGKDGTYVNGRPITYTRITDGSTLKVGRFTFRVSYETSAAPRPLLNSPQEIAAPSVPATGVSEEFVLQLMNQITNMQQQFLIQSQQQTEMMLQFFGTMHANQHELLRDEMTRLHEINREMRDLKQQLERPPQTLKSTRPEMPDRSDLSVEEQSVSPEAETPSRQHERRHHQPMNAKLTPADHSPPRANDAELVADANWRLQKAADLDRSEIELIHPTDVGDEDRSGDSSDREPAAESEAPVPLESEQLAEPIAEQVDDTSIPERDHHAWVLDRMHKLEHERKGLFSKMLKSLFTSNG